MNELSVDTLRAEIERSRERIKELEAQLADVVIVLKQLETEQALQSEALASLEETY